MAYWLLKSDPETYSFQDLVRDKVTFWDGVRNYQARKFLKEMKKGDRAFIYHSQEEKSVVGAAKVTRGAYPDPTDKTGEWVVVDLEAGKAAKNAVTLEAIKKDAVLKTLPLVRQSRLSVMPVSEPQAERLNELLY
ncbi:MAG: EVE domain-containing protein [Candidatus Omnitrophota bacterium]